MSEVTELEPSVLPSCESPNRPFPSPRERADRASVAGGGIGGIIASVSFRQQDALGGYRPGLWTTVAAQLTICITAVLLMLYFRSQNRKADRGEKVLEGHLGKSGWRRVPRRSAADPAQVSGTPSSQPCTRRACEDRNVGMFVEERVYGVCRNWTFLEGCVRTGSA